MAAVMGRIMVPAPLLQKGLGHTTRTCQGFFMRSTSPCKKPCFQIQAEHTALVQGQSFLVYNLKRRETKALLCGLRMQITCMSFPVVFSTLQSTRHDSRRKRRRG